MSVFVMEQRCEDFFAASVPIVLVSDTGALVELKWIRKTVKNW